MNCLEFRRLVSTDPWIRDADVVEHRAACSACSAFARDQERFDERLRGGAMVDVPRGLEKRVLLRQRLRGGRWRRPALAGFALAAVVAVAVFALAGRASPGQQVIDHVRAEWDHGVCTSTVTSERVEETLQVVGAQMSDTADPVVYAGTCGLGDGVVAHVVLDTPFGPVTVLVMPDEPVLARREVVSDGLRAVLLPLGDGGLAIVGQTPDGIARVEAFVRTGVRFGPV